MKGRWRNLLFMRESYAVFFLMAGTLVFSGCTNNAIKAAGLLGNKLTSPNPLSGFSVGSQASAVTISEVIPSNTNPASVFDLIGDGSGALGTLCTDAAANPTPSSSPTGGTAGNTAGTSTGGNNCQCQYDYISDTGTAQSIRVPVLYHESNLVRCTYADPVIPADVPFTQVTLFVTSTGGSSNTITFRFNTLLVSGNTANPSTYVLARRYQCNDIHFFIPHLLNGGTAGTQVYDPLQSEDPSLSYPIDFYTTNVAQSIQLFTENFTGVGLGYLCPPIPNDQTDLLDLTVLSEASDGNSKRIFPPAGSRFDRATFYVARNATGAFSVPVDTEIAPGVFTGPTPAPTPGAAAAAASGTPKPPIGFGAQAIPDGNGGERCPNASDNVTIPNNFHFVKIWLFRSQFAPRQFYKSTRASNLGAVLCNSGKFSDGTPVVKDCGTTGGNPLVDNTILADRIVGQGASIRCMNLDQPFTTSVNFVQFQSGAGYTTDPATLQQKSNTVVSVGNPNNEDFTKFGLGTDLWLSRGNDQNQRCGFPGSFDPMLLCDNTALNVPHDPAPLQTTVTEDLTSPHLDYLFVVSPPTLMLSDMKNDTPAAKPYKPVRFLPPNLCQSVDPDNPTNPGDCPLTARQKFDLVSTDINSNADAAGGSDPRKLIFPICALQPN